MYKPGSRALLSAVPPSHPSCKCNALTLQWGSNAAVRSTHRVSTALSGGWSVRPSAMLLAEVANKRGNPGNAASPLPFDGECAALQRKPAQVRRSYCQPCSGKKLLIQHCKADLQLMHFDNRVKERTGSKRVAEMQLKGCPRHSSCALLSFLTIACWPHNAGSSWMSLRLTPVPCQHQRDGAHLQGKEFLPLF